MNNRFKSALLFIILFFMAVSYTDAKNDGTFLGSDSLKYLGHAFVKIKTAEGVIIFIDPYTVNDFSDSADIVLITHEHGDHNEIARVKQKSTCRIIRSSTVNTSGVYSAITVGNIKITGVPAYNSNHAKNACVGYVIEFNGIKLYHAGDTGKITEMSNLASENLNYALLPMDAVFTMTPEQATEAAAMINAKQYIPIHTMPPPDTYSDNNVARFTAPGKLVVHPNETIALNNNLTLIGNENLQPVKFSLNQNYPNPFNPSTVISYSVPKASFVSVKIFDVLGKEVKDIVGEYQDEGEYKITYNASDLSSGVYLIILKADNLVEVKKCMLMK